MEFDNGVQSIVLLVTTDTFLVSNYKSAKNKLKVYVNEAKIVDIVIDFLVNYGNYRGLDSLYDLSVTELIKVSKDNCGVEFELYR